MGRTCLRVVALIMMLGAAGCAELASAIPSLTIEANATHWRAGSEIRDDESWSWGLRVGAMGSFGEPTSIPNIAREKRAAPLRMQNTRCRIPLVCAWELRSRTRALEHARAILLEEHHP